MDAQILFILVCIPEFLPASIGLSRMHAHCLRKVAYRLCLHPRTTPPRLHGILLSLATLLIVMDRELI